MTTFQAPKGKLLVYFTVNGIVGMDCISCEDFESMDEESQTLHAEANRIFDVHLVIDEYCTGYTWLQAQHRFYNYKE